MTASFVKDLFQHFPRNLCQGSQLYT